VVVVVLLLLLLERGVAAGRWSAWWRLGRVVCLSLGRCGDGWLM
jgi:hypothetical protein